ncbi:MAG: CDP-diacylglycerol--serine O-phosphatidyltransferase [Myxococcota bacterium]
MNAAEEADAKRRKRRRRRRRRDDPDRAGFAALLPQLLTTGNLAAGFFAIIKASNGEVLVASYAIFIAAVFDILDGRAARMTGNVSRFGAEYDSISDTVSFGVAPAVLAFHAGDFVDLRWAGWVMAFVYTACASLRLARFNVQSGRYEGRFDGMPTPAAAGMVLSTVWFKDFLVGPNQELGLPAIIPAIGVVLIGLLMVSPIPYRSFKDLRLGQGFSGTVIPVILLIVLIVEPGLNFFLVGLAYVVSGPAGMLWRWRTGRELLPAKPPDYGDGGILSGAAHRASGAGAGGVAGGAPGGTAESASGPTDATFGMPSAAQIVPPAEPPRARSIWDELDADGAFAESDEDGQAADNVTSLAEYGATTGTRGEGGR